MAREFLLPDLGEGITEAQVIRLLVKQGDQIAEDQYLMEVETDKAVVEIPSPFAGIAHTIHVQEGQTINVGQVIVTFDGDGAAASAAATAKAPPPPITAPTPTPRKEKPVEPSPPAAVATAAATALPTKAPVSTTSAPAAPASRKTTPAAAPAVRKLARKGGIDLYAVQGTGPGGRITREDLERHAAAATAATSASASASAPAVPAVAKPTAPAGLPEGTDDTDKWGDVRRVPLNQIRKTIASQMARSALTAPHVTHVDEADVTNLDRLRRELNEATGGEPKLTVMSFLIRAVCLAINKYPVFNSSFDEDGSQVVYKKYTNIGIAVDTERGLIVPVIRNADRLSLTGIASELRSIAECIRTSRFAIDDLRGGTFTITNVGALGGLFSTPIINYPEVAILGLGRSRRVPVFKGDSDDVTAALMLPLCLSFDHRATDGANAARFTREIIGYLEMPAKFFLG